MAPSAPDSDETVFLPGDATDDEGTGIGSSKTAIDDEATGVGSSETAVDDEATGVGPSETAADDEATRFEPAPRAHAAAARAIEPEDAAATRVVDPSVTRGIAPADSDETRFVDTPRQPSRRPAVPPAGQRLETFAGTRSGAKTTEGPTGPLEVGQAFSNRYHIIRVLGIGGMGAVYHAWDAELGMAVALKVIRPESSNDPAAAREMERRFKQELVLARQVTHKNVVRIHDLGEIDGIKYITMPYLEGSDLATVLKERGKMPVPEALGIIRDVAAGLSSAHEAGIVHRDLKPANIMVLGDHAVIMDFGIARSSKLQAEAVNPLAPAQALDSLKSAGAATVVGTILGTVKYMAPEQARGQAVDQRADIYALGLIFLDMLLGKRHSNATSAIEELKARMEAPPPLVQAIDPSIPKPIEHVIAKCLQPDPEQRYTTSAELVAALDRLDAKGELIPIKRTIRLPFAIAGIVLLLGMSVGVWWYQSQFIPPATHDPVSVLIADFVNTTKDSAFDATLETAMQRALEGAGFISAYDRAGIRRTLGVVPPETLDEAAGLQLAVQQGLGVVLSGRIEPQARGYRLSVRAVRAVTGEKIAEASDTAGDKSKVLASATHLASEVRQALGDDESQTAQQFAMETLSAISLDVVREYAAAMEALSRGEHAKALQAFSRAAERDPNFGLAQAGMAISLFNLRRPQEAQENAKEAISHVAGMTERERFRTRGLYYLVTNDYQSCVKEYNDLIVRYDADAAARNNLALCATQLRDWRRALDEMKRTVQILPKRMLFRGNLAVYLSYSSNFPAGEEEARAMAEQTPLGLTALAFAQEGQGKLTEARQTFDELRKMDEASTAASGLGDLAIYEGKFAEAERILAPGAAADLKAQSAVSAAAKLVAIAHARVLQGRNRPALAAVEEALKASQAVKIRLLAARIAIQAGDKPLAAKLAAGLAKELLAEPRAYAKIVEGGIALDGGDAAQAITLFTDANTLFDTWMGHFDLGRAYLEAGALPQADSEFDRCIGRRGEVLALFLDEEPTFGYLPPVYYYQGRVRQAMKINGFGDSYKQYLAIRGSSTNDRLAIDARKRVGS